MLKTLKNVFAAGLLAVTATAASSQARPTATRLADGQIGLSYSNGNSDYSRSRFNGYGGYLDLDFHHGLGGEFAFHFISDQDSYTNIYERTYLVGPRYSRHYGRFQPYVKGMIGRGVFNYPENTANLAYNLFAGGVGTDVRVRSRINVRVEYEYQQWYSFQPSALTPSILSGGVAYHFK